MNMKLFLIPAIALGLTTAYSSFADEQGIPVDAAKQELKQEVKKVNESLKKNHAERKELKAKKKMIRKELHKQVKEGAAAVESAVPAETK